MKTLKYFMLFTDLGFVLYWFITLFHLLPQEYLFKDYNNPLLVAWNWSFLPLDLMISGTGMLSIFLYQKQLRLWYSASLLSLTLTFCSGLQAIAFWVIKADFDPVWWIPNLFLMIYPLLFLPKLLTNNKGYI